MQQRIQLVQFDQGVGLAGSLMGQQILGQLIAAAPRPSVPTLYFLDFHAVAIATASFVRACVLGFRDYARQQNPNLYPVVANAPDAVIEDLEIVLGARGDAIAACRLSPDGTASEAKVLGQLEAKQQQTLTAVQLLGETDATSLFKKYGKKDSVTSSTAWNNRLVALTAKGLLIEISRGRGKSYRSVLSELTHGA